VETVQDTAQGPAAGQGSGALFDLDTYLQQFNPALFEVAECRRILTRYDPLLFALTYLPEHLRGEETGERITFAECHLAWVEQAKQWSVPAVVPQQYRDAYVAPRGCGKSTWFFLILPLWAAAHGHRKFAAAFADSGPQAQMHLATFKHELESNDLLRADFPELCEPSRRRSGGTESDTQHLLICRNGFVFGAKGIDASSLGMKVGKRRPDLIILDDVEPDESNYSDYQAGKRLTTLIDTIMPLNVYARVVLVGTVTMPDSIVHQLVKTVTTTDDPPKWIKEQNFHCHYYPAIITDPETSAERSIWPQKWPYSWLDEIRGTRQYAKNYANDPLGRDGDYWKAEDITYGEVPALTHQLLSIDPAVTAKEKSDFTALAVIGYSASERRCVVRHAAALKVQPGEALRQRVIAVLEEFEDIRLVVIETDQGGDAWLAILHDLPVKIVTVSQSEPKEVRAARLLMWYQRQVNGKRRVVHEHKLPQAEAQLTSFPKGRNDDLVDAIGTGVDQFFRQRKKKAGGSTSRAGYGGEDTE
jgi:phage terminase large subunit-like protein